MKIRTQLFDFAKHILPTNYRDIAINKMIDHYIQEKDLDPNPIIQSVHKDEKEFYPISEDKEDIKEIGSFSNIKITPHPIQQKFIEKIKAILEPYKNKPKP